DDLVAPPAAAGFPAHAGLMAPSALAPTGRGLAAPERETRHGHTQHPRKTTQTNGSTERRNTRTETRGRCRAPEKLQNKPKGELTFEKGLRLMGKFEGRINTPGRLHIAREARMQADVESGAIIVEGEVKGNLIANDRIELKQTARLEGDLRATKLTVDEGAIFSGHVTVGPDAVKNRPPQAKLSGSSAAALPPPQPQANPVK